MTSWTDKVKEALAAGWPWDGPRCARCHERLVERTARTEANKGRRYRVCPKDCKGSFCWLEDGHP